MTDAIDLNADMGESFGPWRMGEDAAMLDIVSSANIACGFHGGDPAVMAETVALARARGVGVGAHPGFDDLRGFGRRRISGDPPSALRAMLIYQIGALQAIARAAGATVRHVKVHGALNNMMAEDAALARIGVGAMLAAAPELIWVGMAGTHLEAEGRAAGARLAPEIFADRAYEDDGSLARRGTEGAMIHDADLAAENMIRAVGEGVIVAKSGKRLQVAPATICVHGDGPTAVAMAARIRERLEAAGMTIRPMVAD